jgi:fibronectin-binding autotransporter adhesin
LGFDGDAGAVKVGANTVKAGDNVKVFTATGVTTGAVDAGAAGTVNVTGLAGVATTVTVNGDIKTGTGLTMTTADTVTLDFTADAAVSLDTAASAKTTLTGSGDVVLTMTAADVATTETLTNSMEDGSSLTLKTGGAFDATKFSGVDKIVMDSTTTSATVASGQVIETSADLAALTVATTATTATEATLNLGHDITTLDVSDDKLVTTIVNNDVNQIGTLTATGEKVIVTGGSNITIGGADVKTLDASAATGDMALTLVNTASESTISGTSGKNTVTIGHVNDVLSFTGQGGVDTINVIDNAAGTIAGDLGAGNDVVDFKGTTYTGATVALVGGAGTDTIKFVDGASVADVTTWVANGFEAVQVSGGTDLAVDALTLTMDSSQLTGQAYAMSTKEAIDTLDLTVTLDAASADLSGLTFDSGDTVAINGSATTSYTVTGTAAADTFTLGSNAAGETSTITTGAGKDVIVLATDDTAASNMLKVTDFDISASGDKLTTGVVTIVGDKTVDVKAKADDAAFISTEAAAIFADATGNVNVVVKDGIMSLSGLSADVALADTLAEWITLAQYAAVNEDSAVAAAADTVAFVFGGNTYVVETKAETIAEAGGDANVADTSVTLGGVANVVELTGVTSATAMAGAAAADTIFLG